MEYDNNIHIKFQRFQSSTLSVFRATDSLSPPVRYCHVCLYSSTRVVPRFFSIFIKNSTVRLIREQLKQKFIIISIGAGNSYFFIKTLKKQLLVKIY